MHCNVRTEEEGRRVMRRGTTPTVEITVTNDDGTPLDLTNADIHITFAEKSGRNHQITKRESDDMVSVEFDGAATVISVFLTQEETLSFHEGRKVRVQVRSVEAGIALATDIGEFSADEILLEGVI